MKYSRLCNLFLILLCLIPSKAFAGEWTAMQSPLAPGNDLHAVWGSVADNVYAAGTNGAILHYGGSAWSIMNSPTTGDLNGIWGLSGNDIFAVGSVSYKNITHYLTPTIIHYDGTTWNKMPVMVLCSFSSVGSFRSDLFVAEGQDNFSQIIHFDGTCWSYVYNPIHFSRFSAVWGINSSDVYAVQSRGTIAHYDSTVITAMVSGTTHELLGIWGNSQ